MGVNETIDPALLNAIKAESDDVLRIIEKIEWPDSITPVALHMGDKYASLLQHLSELDPKQIDAKRLREDLKPIYEASKSLVTMSLFITAMVRLLAEVSREPSELIAAVIEHVRRQANKEPLQ